MSIDWSKAPDWAKQHGLNAEDSPAWLGLEHYEYVDVPGHWNYGSVGFPRSHFHSVTDRPAAWNGDGHPPIGTACEFSSNGGHNWHRTEVIFTDKAVVLLRGYQLFKVDDPDVVFRPIRTAEQIAAENRITEIDEMLRHIKAWPGGSHGVNHFSQLKIHEDACCDLYEAGYRKQVQP